MPKILVVDDDAAIIELVSVRLRAAGHAVVTAMDGMSASMVATSEKPDLIILDYSMPAASGAKVRERLRGCTFTIATPILVLTASPLGKVAAEMGDDPLLRYMQKPIDFPRFSALVSELLGSAPPPAAHRPAAGDDGVLDLDA